MMPMALTTSKSTRMVILLWVNAIRKMESCAIEALITDLMERLKSLILDQLKSLVTD